MPMGTSTSLGLQFPSSQQLNTATTLELRQLLNAALQEVKEARMSAAHYKLQHNLLELETEETTNRLEVEHEMMRREVEVLQQAELSRRDSHNNHYSSSATEQQDKEDKQAMDRYIAELRAYAEAVGKENAKLLRRFERAKKVIADKEEDIKELATENKRLLDRIRQNREHFQRLTSQGGIYASPQSHSVSANRTVPSTPNYRERAIPRQTPGSARHVQQMRDFNHMQMQNQQQLMQHGTPMQQQHHDRQDSFAALLMADRVLNDQNSAPTTPRRATTHAQNTGHGHPTSSAIRHHRAAQSLSSLPTQPVQMQQYTPMDYAPAPSHAPLLSPPQFGERQGLPGATYHEQLPLPRISPRDRVRRRKSRDSTISASDEEEREKEILRVSPRQPVQLQNPDPFARYAPAQRSMVQARQPQQAQVLPKTSPRYESIAQPQQLSQQMQVDDDETEEEHPEEVQSDVDVPASQASLSASAMLRRDPRESFEIADSPRTQQSSYEPPSQPQPQTMEYKTGAINVRSHPPLSAAGSVTEKGRVLQAKIFGSVTKPGLDGAEKRKRLPSGPSGLSEEEVRAKRLRGKAKEGLGLGLEI